MVSGPTRDGWCNWPKGARRPGGSQVVVRQCPGRLQQARQAILACKYSTTTATRRAYKPGGTVRYCTEQQQMPRATCIDRAGRLAKLGCGVLFFLRHRQTQSIRPHSTPNLSRAGAAHCVHYVHYEAKALRVRQSQAQKKKGPARLGFAHSTRERALCPSHAHHSTSDHLQARLALILAPLLNPFFGYPSSASLALLAFSLHPRFSLRHCCLCRFLVLFRPFVSLPRRTVLCL